jgi:hypothetical protein
LILFYENELNQLFDTYYWLTIQTKEPILPNPSIFRNNPEKLKEFRKRIVEIVKIEDENNFSVPYTEHEKKEIIDKIK